MTVIMILRSVHAVIKTVRCSGAIGYGGSSGCSEYSEWGPVMGIGSGFSRMRNKNGGYPVM